MAAPRPVQVFLVIVVIAVVAWYFLWYDTTDATARRACRDRYQFARTIADTIRIDAVPFVGKELQPLMHTCGEFRLTGRLR